LSPDRSPEFLAFFGLPSRFVPAHGLESVLPDEIAEGAAAAVPPRATMSCGRRTSDRGKERPGRQSAIIRHKGGRKGRERKSERAFALPLSAGKGLI